MDARGLRVGVVGAVIPLVLLTALAIGGDEPGGTRTAVGTKQLKLVRLNLQDAERRVRKPGVAYGAFLREAHEEKVRFIKLVFSGYSYLEDCDAADLLTRIDKVDTAVQRGYYQEGEDRHETLDAALRAARNLDDEIGDCSPADERDSGRMVATLLRLIREHENGTVRDGEDLTRYSRKLDDIVDYNRALISGAADQVAGGCEVPGFQRSLWAIDRSIVIADLHTADFVLEARRGDDREKADAAGAEEEAAELSLLLRRTNLESAITGIKDLIRRWRECSRPACSDRIDNDEDEDTDREDVGCLSLPGDGAYAAEDWSENERDMPASVCPAAGVAATPESPAGYRLTNANAGEEVEVIVLRNMTTQDVLIAQLVGDNTPSGGPVSLGDRVCGPGTQTSVFWEVEGTTVTWDFVFYKDDKDVVPRFHRIVAVANTS